LVTR
jgi:hypothetical protein